jgi:hypothetical protein
MGTGGGGGSDVWRLIGLPCVDFGAPLMNKMEHSSFQVE